MKGWNVKVALGGQFERGFGVKAAGFWVFGEGVDEEIGVKVAVLGSLGGDWRSKWRFAAVGGGIGGKSLRFGELEGGFGLKISGLRGV